jgi:hypothetical protein
MICYSSRNTWNSTPRRELKNHQPLVEKNVGFCCDMLPVRPACHGRPYPYNRRPARRDRSPTAVITAKTHKRRGPFHARDWKDYASDRLDLRRRVS